MTRLVALDLPGGPAFTEALQRTWAAGDAVAVVPPDLPPAARASWLAEVRPHVVVGADGAAPADSSAPELDPGDALVVTTSGSTGVPKVLVHTERSLRAHAAAVHRRLGVDPAADRWLACLPLHHLGGFGVVARAVLDGVGVDVLPRFDAAAVAAAPEALGATLVSLVATALDRVDPAPYRWVVLGGSADHADRPANVVRTYGATETGGGVVYDGEPLDGVEVRVGATGTIEVRSPTLARGRRSPDGAVATLADRDGWFATGDLGALDADGRLVVHGRGDHLIITGGENVWPEVVEARLRAHPAVADALVQGAPDPAWGQRVVASIVPADASAPPTLDALRAHVREALPVAAAPRELRLVATLPRTALGKLVRPAAPPTGQ